MTGYATIVADPPWDYGIDHKRWVTSVHRWSADARHIERPAIPYPPLSLAKIAELPIQTLVDPGGARLFLWTTNRFLPDAFAILHAWGFTYRQTLIWHKIDASPVGGSVAPNHAEFLLVSTCGTVPVKARAASSIITTAKLAHSRKPDAFLDLVEQVSPGPYIELFARRQRLGWDTWGDQALEHVEMSA